MQLLAEGSSLSRTGQELGKKTTANQRFKNPLERKEWCCTQCLFAPPGAAQGPSCMFTVSHGGAQGGCLAVGTGWLCCSGEEPLL